MGVNKQIDTECHGSPTTSHNYNYLFMTGYRFDSITIISHDTKNIYEPVLADKTWTHLAFLSAALYNVVGEEADCNCAGALHMFGLQVR